MRCEKCRELLLTDHLDGRVDPRLKQEIEQHTDSCAECRLILEEIEKQGALSGRLGGVVAAPESVWLRIRAAIEDQPQAQGVLAYLRALLQQHRPAFALSTVISVVVIGVLVARIPQRNNRYALNTYLQSQAQYLASGNGDSVNSGFGTTIEEIFL